MDRTASPLKLDIAQVVDEATTQNGRQSIPEPTSDPIKLFGLSAQLFRDNVNPEYFFRTEAHEETLIAMKRCIEEHISLGLTSTINGTGMTLLTQVLMYELNPRHYRPILVLGYPDMSRTVLLKEIAAI